MISNERLQELIKEGAKIYTLDFNRLLNIEITPDTDTKKIVIGELFLDDDMFIIEGKLHKYDWDISLDKLFETKEDAEFALKYRNITRTETLSLPSWEEFKIVHFIDNVGTHYELEKIRNKICLDFSNDGEYYIKDLQWEATKENYLQACELCRKLFLGENDDK